MSPVSETLRREIEDFLYLEARLADESRYDEWEALAADDMQYWVPRGRADCDPADRLSYINDNRARLATRIRQLKTGPPRPDTALPMRRIVSNIEVLAVDHEAHVCTKVGSNCGLRAGGRPATGAARLAGPRTHRLRRIEGSLRMSRKIVELVAAEARNGTWRS